MKRKVLALVGFIVCIGLLVAVLVPHEAPQIGTPFIISSPLNEPLTLHISTSNHGYGTLQVSMGIWGSSLDVTHGTPSGLEAEKADATWGTTGSGPTIVRSNDTVFLSSFQDYDDHNLLGEIARKRKYPVHLGYAWRRGSLEGQARFVIPPDKDIVILQPGSSK